jgi:CheY-like chemotaxis protein
MPWTECGLAERPVSGVTMDFVDESGDKRIFKVNCSPLFGNEGKIRGVMVSLDDVTQLEKNKIDLKIAKEEADAANKAKGDFLANMSHEIRNPMNAIVGFTDILRRGLEDSESTRTTYLDTIHASGTHLVELINDILDFSKIEAGKLELEIRDCSPYQLMNEVVNVLRMKAEQQSLSLSINLRGAIPETIQADPTRLRQILMNLVGNAIKFTAEGGVRIVASMEEKGGQPFLRFEVTDTGIGMTQEQIGRLFQEFMQADSSVTRRFGGTGLGLAISKRLTEAMGGQIAVRSEPGVGSTFYFSIATGDLSGVPMLDAEQASEKFRSAARSKQHGLRVYFKTARVLITDDTPANRQLAGLVLRKAGLTVDEAENGAIAVEKASCGTYDLLLMDMQMPVMDGFTATRTLRDQGLKTPILAFTANVMEQDRQRCVAAGCSGFLTKPINIDLLLSTIAEYLETTDAPPELPAPVDHPVADNSRTEVSATPPASKFMAESSLDEILDQLPGVAGIRELDRSQRLDSGSARGFQETVRRPIYSTLPLDIPEFREIVESFVGCMDDTMHSLRAAQARMDYQEVREIAHRLKGTGGTVGFAAFTEPSRKLQLAAEERDDATIDAMLLELEDMISRIELPTEV